MSEASVSTCSLISVTLHSLGLEEMSAPTRNQGRGKSLQQPREAKKERGSKCGSSMGVVDSYNISDTKPLL